MASKVQGLTVVINGDTTRLKSALRDVKSEATVLRTHLSALGKLLEFNPASTELISQKQRLLGEALAANAKSYRMMQDAEAAYNASVGPHTEAEVTEYRNLQRQMTNNRLEYERLKQQAITFGTAASTSTLAVRGHLQKVENSLRNVSTVTLAVAAGMAYLGYKALDAAASYESAFAGVRKTINTTEEEYKKLSNAIREMALVKPVSQENIAYIMELGGQLNIASQHLEVFAATIADLDVSTDLNLEDASLKLAQFANIVQMSQGDFDRLGAVIADLGNNTATTESQIVNMGMRIAGSASNIGMTAAEVMALAASLSAVGIQAEMGGNAISTIMNRIDKDVALNKDTVATWAATAGMSSEQFKEAWTTNVTETLQAVITGMGTFRDEGNNLNVLLKDMGITYMRQIDTMQRLSRTGDLLTANFQRANTAWDQNLALTREANQRYATAESKIQLMKNAVNECGIAIGEGILPAFKDIVVSVTDAVKSFANMDDSTKTFIITAGGVATVALASLKGIQLLAAGGKNLISMYASLKTALAFYTVEQNAAKAATVAMAGAESAETAAKLSNNAATVEAAASQSFATVAKGAAATASKGLTTALRAESIAMAASMGVIGLAAVGVLLLANNLKEAAEGTKTYTQATKDQAAATNKAKVEYYQTAAAEGEFSKAAVDAKYAMEQEEQTLESSKETMAEFRERIDDTVQAHESLMNTIRDTYDTASSSAGKIGTLVEQITKLQESEGTASEKAALMDVLTNQLNNSVEGLHLSYNSLTGQLNMADEQWKALAESEKDAIMADAAMENYSSLLAEQIQLTTDYAEAQYELENASKGWGLWIGDFPVIADPASVAYHDLESSADSLNDALEENARKQEEAQRICEIYASRQLALKYATDELAGGTRNAAEAAEFYSEMFGVNITEADVLAERERRLAEATRTTAEAYEDLRQDLEELMVTNGFFADVLVNSQMSLDDLCEALEAAGIKSKDFEKAIDDMSGKVANAFDKIEVDSESSLESMIENLEHNISVTSGWRDNIIKLYSEAGSASEANFIAYIANLGPEYAPIVEALVNDTSGMKERLVDLYGQAGGLSVEAVMAQLNLLPGQVSDAGDAATNEASEAAQGITNAFVQETPNTQNATAMLVEGVDYETAQLPGKLQTNANEATTDFVNAINSAAPAAAAAADDVSKLVSDHLSSASIDAWWAGHNMTAESFKNGIESGTSDAVAAADNASKQVADHFSSANSDAWWAGYNMTLGLAQGIRDGKSEAVNAAKEVAEAAVQAARDAAEINSPSKVMARIGEGYPEGLALGMRRMTHLAVDAANKMTEDVLSASGGFKAAMSSIGGGTSLTPSISNELTPMQQQRVVVNVDGSSSDYNAIRMAVEAGIETFGDKGFSLEIEGREFGRAVRKYG